jgi:hypothetical protein
MTIHRPVPVRQLFRQHWATLDSDEVRFILLETIGKPGQYDGATEGPYSFYLPLARDPCQIKLTFGSGQEIVAIDEGPAFDPVRWELAVQEIERTGPQKVGRDFSFGSYRVTGSWRGAHSGIQILPPPPAAPQAPYEMGAHPFVLEFPMVGSDNLQIANTRRRREHMQWTLLLNVLLNGHTTANRPPQTRHTWVIGADHQSYWLQEGYIADIGTVISDAPSKAEPHTIEEVEPNAYYAGAGIDGKPLRVPSDLDDSLCRYLKLRENLTLRNSFHTAAFWMHMASEQWTISQSTSFASLAIAIEALGDRDLRPTARFSSFIERYAPESDGGVRKALYDLRSVILHGERLMPMDRGAYFGWSPPEKMDGDLHEAMWRLAQIAIRNWIKSVPQ